MAVHETIFFKAFQFTPLREGRQIVSAFSQSCLSFQFTPLREGRPCRTRHPRLVSISIHAPPRGATDRPCRLAHALLFQFTPLREGRRHAHRSRQQTQKFQFTPLREGRRELFKRCSFAIEYFNSRPSARGDRNAKRHPQEQIISIHAPPRGATARRCLNSTAKYFNSRPSARGDSKRYAISANLLFNPYKSAWLNNNATQFVEIILVIFHRIIA